MVRVDLHNNYLIGDTWSSTASMGTLKYLLVDDVNHKAIVHQLDVIGAFLQAKVKNGVFVNLDIIYADYLHHIQVVLEET